MALVMALMTALAAEAECAAGRAGSMVRDPALHRQWKVERDGSHPERPARLMEVPWDDTACSDTAKSAHPGQAPREALERKMPVVRGGMWVRVRSQDAESRLELRGIALDSGQVGERIRVRAGLRGTILRAVVRGAGEVELERGKR